MFVLKDIYFFVVVVIFCLFACFPGYTAYWEHRHFRVQIIAILVQKTTMKTQYLIKTELWNLPIKTAKTKNRKIKGRWFRTLQKKLDSSELTLDYTDYIRERNVRQRWLNSLIWKHSQYTRSKTYPVTQDQF